MKNRTLIEPARSKGRKGNDQRDGPGGDGLPRPGRNLVCQSINGLLLSMSARRCFTHSAERMGSKDVCLQ